MVVTCPASRPTITFVPVKPLSAATLTVKVWSLRRLPAKDRRWPT
jgi:hypothetical protein